MDKLRDFFPAYFNEDWAHATTDYLKVVDEYVAAWRDVPEEVRGLAEALQVLGDESNDDHELETLLATELGSYFVPSRWGLSARQWILTLATHLMESVSADITPASGDPV